MSCDSSALSFILHLCFSYLHSGVMLKLNRDPLKSQNYTFYTQCIHCTFFRIIIYTVFVHYDSPFRELKTIYASYSLSPCLVMFCTYSWPNHSISVFTLYKYNPYSPTSFHLLVKAIKRAHLPLSYTQPLLKQT